MFKNNRSLAIIALISIVNALGYGIIIPILYSYSHRFGLTDFQNGILFALFSLCQFLSTPVIGRLSDKYGRKPLLIISVSGTAVSFLMMAFAPSAIFLFLARALDGITAGNIPVATAVITDTTKPQDRAKGFGIIGAAFGLGFIVGPMISALTVGINPALPFLIAAAITILAVVLTILFLPETNKAMGKAKKEQLFNFKKLIHALEHGVIGTTLLVTLFYNFAFAMFIFAFQSSTAQVLHMSPNQISLIFSLFGLIGVIAQVFLIKKVLEVFKIKKTMYYSLIAVAMSFLWMYVTRSQFSFVIACVMLALTNSFVQPLTQTFLSEETSETEQGEIMGINTSYMSIGQIIGPVVAGALATVSISTPFLGAALCTVVCIYLTKKIFRHKEVKFV